jgi:hypothetical protein
MKVDQAAGAVIGDALVPDQAVREHLDLRPFHIDDPRRAHQLDRASRVQRRLRGSGARAIWNAFQMRFREFDG